MTPETIPVFVNDRPLRVPVGATLGSILAEHDPDLLAEVLGGSARVTDGRLIPVDPDGPVHAGAIYRVSRSARAAGAADA